MLTKPLPLSAYSLSGIRPSAASGTRRLGDLLMGISVIMIAVGATVGYVGPAWTFFLAFPLGAASFLAGLSCWTFPDIDGTTERVVVELRKTEPNQQISVPADDTERLAKRVGEEIRAVLSAQARQDLRWAWFFFLLGIPVGVVIQLLVR